MRGPGHGPSSGREGPHGIPTRPPMAKKKAKGVLGQIGEAVSAGAGAVADAGSRAIHAVGEMIPAVQAAPKRAASRKATPKVKKAAPKAKKAAPAAAKVKKVEEKAAAKPKAVSLAKKAPATVRAAPAKRQARSGK